MLVDTLKNLSINSLKQLFLNKKLSVVELTTHLIAHCQQDSLGCFLAMNPEFSMLQALESDRRIAKGQARPLEGLPIAHKDIFVTKNFPTTAGSKLLKGYQSPFDATVVDKLAQAGAVCLGKLNCDEFAMGSSNENSAYGPVKNPWHTDYIPGGSSGASAAAVASGLVSVSTGTDTGGSIRQPASFCGVTGIKPTYGRISRYGMIAFASSLDQAGPIGQNAYDCALLLNVLCGDDSLHDATSLKLPSTDFTTEIAGSLQGLRVGLPEEWFQPAGVGMHDDVRQCLENARDELSKLGVKWVPVSLKHADLAIPVYYIVACAEASSNLSRFDGVKYGYRAPANHLEDLYVATRSNGFGLEVQRRILMGTYVLSHGYYDAYYLQAQKLRRLIAEGFVQAFQQCDVILGPVAPTPAWKLGEKADPLSHYLADIYTLPASLAGLPAMSLPAGFSADGLPIGLQLIGNYLDEGRILKVAHNFQQVTHYHLRKPRSTQTPFL
ncbi:MAG: Asp-tRNA(Asn)/Glu-tRNA(Gln) amidotransferase subunit GatA [Gammaproteobacteria bacterium]|nr:Asp-tRNA(Asn)/Glu-tRNA(Gln) amidotransferase subunit GatA [Gammaproteobacteria bacterium]